MSINVPVDNVSNRAFWHRQQNQCAFLNNQHRQTCTCTLSELQFCQFPNSFCSILLLFSFRAIKLTFIMLHELNAWRWSGVYFMVQWISWKWLNVSHAALDNAIDKMYKQVFACSPENDSKTMFGIEHDSPSSCMRFHRVFYETEIPSQWS